jgi:small subunit ribosomal protein S17
MTQAKKPSKTKEERQQKKAATEDLELTVKETEEALEVRNNRAPQRASQKRTGIVVSNKAQKTITVSVLIRYQHRIYGKTLIQTKRYLAHDETETAMIGQIVTIEECAPYSKRKTWKLTEKPISVLSEETNAESNIEFFLRNNNPDEEPNRRSADFPFNTKGMRIKVNFQEVTDFEDLDSI